MTQSYQQYIDGQLVDMTEEEIVALDQEIQDYLDSLPTIKMAELRVIRNRLLAESDYTQLPDTPITELCRQDFIDYRIALRNMPETADPLDPVWPTKPEYITV